MGPYLSRSETPEIETEEDIKKCLQEFFPKKETTIYETDLDKI